MTSPVATRFVVVRPDRGSMLSFVVCNPVTGVNDIAFRGGGIASIAYSLWPRAGSWNDEIGFNNSAVVSTCIKPAAVIFRAEVFTLN